MYGYRHQSSIVINLRTYIYFKYLNMCKESHWAHTDADVEEHDRGRKESVLPSQ